MTMVPKGVVMVRSSPSYWNMPTRMGPPGGTSKSAPVPRMPMVARGDWMVTPSGLALANSPVTMRKVPWAMLSSMVEAPLSCGL